MGAFDAAPNPDDLDGELTVTVGHEGPTSSPSMLKQYGSASRVVLPIRGADRPPGARGGRSPPCRPFAGIGSMQLCKVVHLATGATA
jgi:hypothetical protein